jgi:general secretion pathway protein J
MAHPGATNTAKVKQQTAGFTLLEILVAVVMMAVIMTMAFGALRLGERSWQAAIDRASGNETFRAVADLLRRQIVQIIPMAWPGDTQQRIAFEGAPTQLSFIAPAPQQYAQAGLFEYRLSAQRGAKYTRLVLSYLPFKPGTVEFQPPTRRGQLLLVEGLHSVSFDYFGNPEPAGPGGRSGVEPSGWHQRWNSDAQRFPDLIRVRMEINEGQQPWPDLYLALPSGRRQ